MLFAQASRVPAVGTWVFLAAAVAAAGLAVVVLFIVVLRQLRTSREMRHQERLRAIEMGTSLDPDPSVDAQAKYMHNAFWIAFWMVFLVSGGAFSAAASCTERGSQQVGVLLAMWISAAAASVASVICATVVMTSSRSTGSGVSTAQTTKPPKWAEH